jgi:hypothetical protein
MPLMFLEYWRPNYLIWSMYHLRACAFFGVWAPSCNAALNRYVMTRFITTWDLECSQWVIPDACGIIPGHKGTRLRMNTQKFCGQSAQQHRSAQALISFKSEIDYFQHTLCEMRISVWTCTPMNYWCYIALTVSQILARMKSCEIILCT